MKLPSQYLRVGAGSEEYNKEAEITLGMRKPFTGTRSPMLAYPTPYGKSLFEPNPLPEKIKLAQKTGVPLNLLVMPGKEAQALAAARDELVRRKTKKPVRNEEIDYSVADEDLPNFTPLPPSPKPSRKRKISDGMSKEGRQELYKGAARKKRAEKS